MTRDTDIAALGPGGPCTPEPLIGAITAFLAHQRFPREEMRSWLEQEIRHEGADALSALRERLLSAGGDWSYFPPDPLARRIHHLLATRLLDERPVLIGAAHLAIIGRDPVVIVANHLSYADANVVEVLLHQNGAADLAARLTVVAGPKVYSNLKRRFSSLCFGTIKTPQSSGVSSDEAVMNPREVAMLARRSIQIAQERLAAGDALLVFAEGTRSRAITMQPLLHGVTRYFDDDRVWILPVGLAGSEALFPIGEDGLHPSRITMTIGRPFRAGALRAFTGGNRKLMMDVIGVGIARLLPPTYRGVYGEVMPGLDDARLFYAGA